MNRKFKSDEEPAKADWEQLPLWWGKTLPRKPLSPVRRIFRRGGFVTLAGLIVLLSVCLVSGELCSLVGALPVCGQMLLPAVVTATP